MESEHNSTYSDRNYPAYYDLHWELVHAIEKGNIEKIVAAVDTQPCNDVTEGISNALVVRRFLFEQAAELQLLSDEIASAKTTGDILSAVGRANLRSEKILNETFAARESSSQYAKLSGDNRFREKLSERDDDMPEFARRISNIKVSSLLQPSDLYDEMHGMSIYLADELWGEASALHEMGMEDDSIEDLQEMIGIYIDMIKSRIELDFPE